jgi:O-succinylbenzoic acid--CoA ligase
MFIIPFSTLTDSDVARTAMEKLPLATAEWEQDVWKFLINWYHNNSDTIEVFSSGSTGPPKAIQHSKKAMQAHAQITCETLQLPRGITAWLCLPASKIGGMMMLVRSMVNRMDLLCTKPSANPFEDLDDNHAVAFAALTPMQMKATETDYTRYRKMNRIKTILLGGEAVSAGLIKHLYAAENNIYATFGMTETISHIALKKLNGLHPDAHYKTLNGITVATDERNCLVVHAPAIGISNMATNDLATIVSATEFDWLGRIDHIINTGGIKVIPEAVEQKLLPFMNVPFFIAGMPDETTGSKVTLVLEATGLTQQDHAKLQECFKVLGKYETPRAVLVAPAFVKTENGKIKRAETLRMAAAVTLG